MMRVENTKQARISRRQLLQGTVAAGATFSSGTFAFETNPEASSIHRVNFTDVVRRARELASAPFNEQPTKLAPAIDNLDYDSWRDIRFRPERAIPLGPAKAFRLETFHLGFLYRRAVTVNVIQNGISAPLLYSPNLFEYGRVKLDRQLPIDSGFAGFRLHYPLNDPHVQDELISFLGASYFRFLGREQQYGLSARALCVEAGTARESFPFFREFWLDASEHAENHITIYGLLDGEAATGAFRFDVMPGQDTTIDVDATLFPRRAGVKFGLAPLTSMYLTGENDHRVRDGFRAELHDSDGLLMLSGQDEWIWRPLANPVSIRATSFSDKGAKGFGLLQRDRVFESYQDLELAYEFRPSYFVEPKGDWGVGRVELIELSTPDETNDNIVVSWTADASPPPLEPFSYSYRLTAFLDDSKLSPNGRVVNTFLAPARALGSAEKAAPGTCRFLVDFAKGDLAYYVRDPSDVQAVATSTRGKILRASVAANPHIEGLRAMFDVAVPAGETSDLRVFLRAGQRCLTETWTFPWAAPALPDRAAVAPSVTASGSKSAELQATSSPPQHIQN